MTNIREFIEYWDELGEFHTKLPPKELQEKEYKLFKLKQLLSEKEKEQIIEQYPGFLVKRELIHFLKDKI